MTSRRRVRHTRTQIHEHTHTHIHTGTHTNVKHEHIKLKPKFLGNIWILDLFYVMCYMLVDTYNYIVQSQITIDYYKIYTLRLKLYLFFCSVFQRTVGWIHVLEELGLTRDSFRDKLTQISTLEIGKVVTHPRIFLKLALPFFLSSLHTLYLYSHC